VQVATLFWAKTTVPGIYRHKGPRGTRYKATFRDLRGNSRSKTFRTLAEARSHRNNTAHRKISGTFTDPSLGRVRLEDFWRHAEAVLEPSLKPKTWSHYSMQYRVHIRRVFGDYQLSSITRADVNEFFAGMAKAGKGGPTISGVQRLFHRLLALAVEENRIAVNPVPSAKVTRTERRKPVFLSAEQVRAISEKVPARYRALVRFLAFTGLRIGEATALKVKNLDLKEGLVQVVESAPELNGKALHGSATKTDKTRVAHIGPNLAQEMTEHLNTYGNRFDPSSFVFTADNGQPVLPSAFRRHILQPAAKAAKIDPVPRVHDLRHTAASLMAQTGYSMRQAQEELGHSHATMTDAYTHLWPADQAAAAGRLDALLG